MNNFTPEPKTLPVDIELTFISQATPAQTQQIIALYRGAGWWSEAEDDPGLVSRIITGSFRFLIAGSADRIVGMGRALSDGASDAYIQDITVAGDFRGRGLGSRIIQTLIDRLRTDGLSWIGLIAERNTHPFYSRLGFKPMPDAMPMLLTTSSNATGVPPDHETDSP